MARRNLSDMDEKQVLKSAYSLIADLWCSPPETDAEREEVAQDVASVVGGLASIDEASAMLLSDFLEKNSVSDEDYIDLFELQPKCALYLGSHTFDEPKTCANAAVSDRNGYMIELVGIYKHFGQELDGKELPDYLPLMVEFLSLTVDSRDDPIRGKFIAEYIVPFLPPMRSRLEELETPYLHLFGALEKVMSVDLKSQSLPIQPKQPEEFSHVG